jgi:hypothetical protein
VDGYVWRPFIAPTTFEAHRRTRQPSGQRGKTNETEILAMNTNNAVLTELLTAQSGSAVQDNAPNAPANVSFDLVVEAVAGNAVGNSNTPYTLQISVIDLTAANQPWPPITLAQAFNGPTGWNLSGGIGPDYECSQTFPMPVPGGPGGPLAGHTLQYTASLVSANAQIVSIIEGAPFVLV